MKKVSIMLLAGLFAVTVTGCGSKKDEQGSQEPDPKETKRGSSEGGKSGESGEGKEADKGGGGKDALNEALLQAAIHGKVGEVKKLLGQGADVNTKNNDGWTPLIYSAKHGYTAVVKELLKAKASLDDKTKRQGYSALSFSAKAGHLPIVEALLKAGAKVDVATTTGDTPLLIAAKKGRLKVVKALVKAGADITHKNKRGWDAETSSRLYGEKNKATTDYILSLKKKAKGDGAPKKEKK